ncbi:uncharacterized protein K441DRAFT_330598 [Cenococcum geophilum 1.58]|uniref:Uncharacterized protein n=1 Tax=Cenococcum geophilum 1.58 TaxID=794803 RepID=A0ACC8EP04_9PEZI|nr:hypothetical protein K441DRAFT_330598 [Cenococcum geophilum 1.58]
MVGFLRKVMSGVISPTLILCNTIDSSHPHNQAHSHAVNRLVPGFYVRTARLGLAHSSKEQSTKGCSGWLCALGSDRRWLE